MLENYKIIPVSVLDVEKAGKLKIRGDVDHDKKSSRSDFSPFPNDVNTHCYEYFLRSSDTIFDPFAGWGERHAKAVEYNKLYTGFDMSEKALEYANENFGVQNILADSRIADIPEHNGLITCPPYWNLEKYEGNGLQKDKTWDDFISDYATIFKRAVEKAQSGATYCIMTGDWRSKGVYYDLTFQTEKIFHDLGIKPFDKVVVSRKKNSKIKIMLPQAKRLGYTVKVHENLLVYKI
jgi:hypothetical protein